MFRGWVTFFWEGKEGVSDTIWRGFEKTEMKDFFSFLVVMLHMCKSCFLVFAG